MDNCIFCGGPAGINVVERPNGPLHYSRIDCAEYLKKELEQKNLQIRDHELEVQQFNEGYEAGRAGKPCNPPSYERDMDQWAVGWTWANSDKLQETLRLNGELNAALQLAYDWMGRKPLTAWDEAHLKVAREKTETVLKADLKR